MILTPFWTFHEHFLIFHISFSFKMEKELCWMISHKYPFLISSWFPQTWFGNKNTSSALWTPYSFTTTMPQRSRKLLFLYCADPRGNKYIVQSHPAKLCWGTRCWALQPFFSGVLPIKWKTLENTVFLHMCLQSSQASRAGSQLGSQRQWQFCTGQVLHFSGEMQVTGGCSSLILSQR